MREFYGRQRELAELRELLLKQTASLVVIKGRRRVGKSRLAEEFGKAMRMYTFTGLPPTEKVTSRMQRNEFARQLHESLAIPLPRPDDWGDLFTLLAKEVRSGRILIVLDEINWMGNKDPTFLGKLKNAWDQQFSKNGELILILCGSVSAWIEQKILRSTGFVGRVSLDLTLEELPLHECNFFWGPHHHLISSFDKFKILSITGGIPRYLEELVPSMTAEENIHRLCFRKTGLLTGEFEKLFTDLFRKKSDKYKTIIEKLIEGACPLDDIYRALKTEKTGKVIAELEELIESGFVARDYTWNLKTGMIGKLSHFRLRDNYSRFYLKYIRPNIQKIKSNSIKTIPGFESILGLQFENLVLNNRSALHAFLNIDPDDIISANPFFQNKNKKVAGCQIDYMIQTKQGNLFVCEIKFSQSELKSTIIEEVQKKVHRLVRPKSFSVRPVLIHVGGVNKAIIQSGFFHAIIDFGVFLKQGY